MSDVIHLAGGAEVPRYLVDALDRFDRNEWDGSTYKSARPAIVNVILVELHTRMVEHIYETLVQELKLPEEEARLFAERLARKLVK